MRHPIAPVLASRRGMGLAGGRSPARWQAAMAHESGRLGELGRLCGWVDELTAWSCTLRQGPLLGAALDRLATTRMEPAPGANGQGSGGHAPERQPAAGPGGDHARAADRPAGPRPGRHAPAVARRARRPGGAAGARPAATGGLPGAAPAAAQDASNPHHRVPLLREPGGQARTQARSGTQGDRPPAAPSLPADAGQSRSLRDGDKPGEDGGRLVGRWPEPVARRAARRLTAAAAAPLRPERSRRLAAAVRHAWEDELVGPAAPGELLARLVRSTSTVRLARPSPSGGEHQTVAPALPQTPVPGEEGRTADTAGQQERMADTGDLAFREVSSGELPTRRGAATQGADGRWRFQAPRSGETEPRGLEPLPAPEVAVAGRRVDTEPLAGEVGRAGMFDPPLGLVSGSTAPTAEPPSGRWSPSEPLRGASAEATGEDLTALAARLQRILKEEARRHGINV